MVGGSLHTPMKKLNEGVDGGDEAERSLDGLASAVDAVDHPLEDARILTVARPQERPALGTLTPTDFDDIPGLVLYSPA